MTCAETEITSPRATFDQGAEGLPSLLDFQPRIREYFDQAYEKNSINHSYLFVGTSGCGIDEMIDDLAYHVLSQGAHVALSHEAAARLRASIAHKTHPDLVIFEPESARGYVVSQTAQIIEEALRPPFSAACKLIVIQEANMLGVSCANALLKTLEEPASAVYFVLVSTSQDAVLPTIVSRCNVLLFEAISGEHALHYVQTSAQCLPDQAQSALYLAQSPIKAVEILQSQHWMNIRSEIIHFFEELSDIDAWDIVCHVKAISDELCALHAPLQEQADRELARTREFLPAVEYKKLELSYKRRLARMERDHMLLIFDLCESFARDISAAAFGATVFANPDQHKLIEHLAHTISHAISPAAPTHASADLHTYPHTDSSCLAQTPAAHIQELFATAREELISNTPASNTLECLLLGLADRLFLH